MAASTDLLPGETVYLEEFAPPAHGMLLVAAFLVLFGLMMIRDATVGAILILAVAGGFYWLHTKRAAKAKQVVTVRVTNRRVIAYSAKGVDEMQVAKIESVRADAKSVTVSGSGGAKFTITGGKPLEIREAIQRALAEQQT